MSVLEAKKKRSKAYYGVRPAKRRRLGRPEADLSPGMKGIIITTNVPEKRCVLEAYQILNEYGDTLYGPENCSDSGEDEEDIEKAVAREIDGLKNTRQERRFQATNTGVKNVVFIQCRDPVEPCELIHYLFKEIVEEGKQKSRFCQRVIPVTMVCRATEQDIVKHAPSVLAPHFHVQNLQAIKFAVNYKARNNSSVKRDAIIDQIATLVTRSNEYPHVVDLNNPDLVVIVDVVKNLCCLSVVKDFMTFRKYNLHVVMEPDEDCNTASAQTKDEKVEAKIVRRDEHEGGDEETFRAAKDPQDGDMAAAKMLDGAKSGDVDDCVKSGDVDDGAKSGDVDDGVKSGDVDDGAKSGDVDDGAKSGDVDDGAKSGDVDDCVKSGDVDDGAKSGDVDDGVKSGDVDDGAKSGDVGNQAGAAVSGEVTPAPAVEQLQQAPCEESCERQQTSNCGNTEP